VLVAYNFPSGITVHRIKGDGTIGDTVAQPDNLETGIYFHQVRMTPSGKTVTVVARGNNPEGGKGEDPGSLHVYGFKNGVLSNLHKIQPNGGYGYGPRHLDFHPTEPWVYLSIERQNQLIVYRMTPDGDLVTEPLFTKDTLADPAHKIRVQGAGPIHVHPNGRFLYQGNRSGVATAAGPGIEDVDGKKVFTGGESNIVVWTINPQTGEPTAVQHADIHAAHPRTFALDTSAKMLVGAVADGAARERQGRRYPGGALGVPRRPRWQARLRAQIRRRRQQGAAVVDRHGPARLSATGALPARPSRRAGHPRGRRRWCPP
jgi:6-phosphogluconolactonase